MRADRHQNHDRAAGFHLPHLLCLGRTKKILVQDNAAHNLLDRVPLDNIWLRSGLLPHQIDACFVQKHARGSPVEDITGAWRQAKNTHGITGAALSMRLVAANHRKNEDFSFDVPFLGDVDAACNTVMSLSDWKKPAVCMVFITYGRQVLAEINLCFDCVAFCNRHFMDIACAGIAARHGVDSALLQKLFFEGAFHWPDLPIGRNLHRHVADKTRALPNSGFDSGDPTALLPLIDNGDLVWATTVKGQDDRGRPVLWSQDPTLTDQGIARWAEALWEMKVYMFEAQAEWNASMNAVLSRDAFFAGLNAVPVHTTP